MRVFNNYRELRTALDKDPAQPGAFRFLPEYAPACFVCSECKEQVQLVTDGNQCGTGYGLYSGTKHSKGYAINEDAMDDAMVCYACCGTRDRAILEKNGKGYMYLNEKTGTLSNWCGSLVLQAEITYRGPDKVGFRFELPKSELLGSSVQTYETWSGTLHRKNDNMLTLVKRSTK